MQMPCLSYGRSVCLSVCLDHTLLYCIKTTKDMITKSSPFAPRRPLPSGFLGFFPKFERGHPDRQRAEMAGVNRIGDFQLINRRISETVQDSAKVTINHY